MIGEIVYARRRPEGSWIIGAYLLTFLAIWYINSAWWCWAFTNYPNRGFVEWIGLPTLGLALIFHYGWHRALRTQLLIGVLLAGVGVTWLMSAAYDSRHVRRFGDELILMGPAGAQVCAIGHAHVRTKHQWLIGAETGRMVDEQRTGGTQSGTAPANSDLSVAAVTWQWPAAKIQKFNRWCNRITCLIFLLFGLLLPVVFHGAFFDFPQYYMGGLAARHGAMDSVYPISTSETLNPGWPLGSALKPATLRLSLQNNVPTNSVRFIQSPPNAYIYAPWRS